MLREGCIPSHLASAGDSSDPHPPNIPINFNWARQIYIKLEATELAGEVTLRDNLDGALFYPEISYSLKSNFA